MLMSRQVRKENHRCSNSRSEMVFWKNVAIALGLSLAGVKAFPQADTVSRFSFSTYAELYYSYDFNNPSDKLRPPFLYSFNRHNDPKFNIALVKGGYNTERLRFNVALMAGTYSKYNLAQEPDLLQHIYEANFGLRLGKKDLWLDVGLIPSHIGFESAIGKDCFSLTRSIMGDNSPYFETGLKLSSTHGNGRWVWALLLLNGWQRIQFISGNSLPSFGHQLQFKPNDKVLINSSSFIGTDKPDSARKMRYFHNLYGIFKLSNSLDFQMAFDIGAEQKVKGGKSYNNWYTSVAGFRIMANRVLQFCTQLEYYNDMGSVLTSTSSGLPLSTFGISETVDLHIYKNLEWRFEWRWLNGTDDIFLKDGLPVSSNHAVTTSLAFYFSNK
jgi:hypothetical protein